MAYSKQQILEYLDHAIKLERSVLTQEGIIEDYGKISERKKPVKKSVQMPQSPKLPAVTNEALIFIGVLCAIVALAFFFYGAEVLLTTRGIETGTRLIVGLLFLGVGAGSLYIPIAIWTKNRHEQKTASENYTTRREECLKQQEQLNREFDQNYLSWRQSNEKAIRYLNPPLANTKKVLQQLYSKDCIYPKYHNLAALTSIYEYLYTGRCDELTGPHGAYNLYESELRQNTVISQLNVIIQDLEQIKNNQYMLYQQMKEYLSVTRSIAQNIEQIRSYTYDISQYSAISAYYNGIAAMNTSTLSYCKKN